MPCQEERREHFAEKRYLVTPGNDEKLGYMELRVGLQLHLRLEG